MAYQQQHKQQKSLSSELRINREIRARMVRLVGDNIDNQNQIIPFFQALKMAEDQELDLVEISPTADPPVCKILDYQKYMYHLKKKQKEIKAKTVKTVIKEIRFGPNTDDHDYKFKLKHAMNFLEEGEKVKAFVFFKGRSIVYKEQGEILLLRFAQDLEEYGKVDQMPRLDGKRMTMFLSPKPKKSKVST